MKTVGCCIVFLTLFFISQTSGLKCSGYFAITEHLSAQFGYCWKYIPTKSPINNTVDYCTRTMRGRMPVIDTPEKAEKLSKYIEVTLDVFKSGEHGTWWEKYFTEGAAEGVGTTVWISPAHSSGTTMLWNTTNTTPSPVTHEKGTPTFVNGNACTLFSGLTSTWKFVGCGYHDERWPQVCEEPLEYNKETVAQTPEVTVAVSDEGEEEGEGDEYSTSDYGTDETGNCPAGFQYFEDKYCFKLGPGSGAVFTFAQWFCEENGGYMVRINTEKKDDAVQRYLDSNLKISDSEGAFLDAVHFKGQDMVWSSDDKNALYVKSALYMKRPRPMRPIFISKSSVDGKRIRHCPTGPLNKCRRTAFCEATPKNTMQPSHDIEDYY